MDGYYPPSKFTPIDKGDHITNFLDFGNGVYFSVDTDLNKKYVYDVTTVGAISDENSKSFMGNLYIMMTATGKALGKELDIESVDDAVDNIIDSPRGANGVNAFFWEGVTYVTSWDNSAVAITAVYGDWTENQDFLDHFSFPEMTK